jgi:hypothetical protein
MHSTSQQATRNLYITFLHNKSFSFSTFSSRVDWPTAISIFFTPSPSPVT